MKHHVSLARPSLLRGALGLVVAASVAVAPMQVHAAPPAKDAKAGEEATESSTKGEVGGTVAVLVFEGDEGVATSMRYGVQGGLEEKGYTVVGVKRTATESAEKVKCKGDGIDDACRERIGQYLAKNAKSDLDFYVYGMAADVPGGLNTVVIYDIKAKVTVKEISYARSDGDVIAPLALKAALSNAIAWYQVPRAPISADEQAILDGLDEPTKTAEEIAAEEEALKKAQEERLRSYNQGLDVGEQKVSLKDDFKDFCREGKRQDKVIELEDGTTEKEKDLRPKCQRGPFFGYWQPRSWVALGLTLGSAVGMGISYGAALGARSSWNDSKDALEASGLSKDDPATATEYARLAGAVSDDANTVRQRALIGDILLGTTVLLFGVTAIIVFQDRNQAKQWIKREKELRITDLKVGPTFERNGGGVGASFRF